MSETANDASPKTARHGFGFQPTPRRRMKPFKASPGGPTDAALVRAFIEKNGVTVCETRYAEGAVKPSGEYDF